MCDAASSLSSLFFHEHCSLAMLAGILYQSAGSSGTSKRPRIAAMRAARSLFLTAICFMQVAMLAKGVGGMSVISVAPSDPWAELPRAVEVLSASNASPLGAFPWDRVVIEVLASPSVDAGELVVDFCLGDAG